MEPVVRVERAECSGRMSGVVIGELGQRKKAGPVGLLVVTIHPQVLLQHRIQPLRLAIRLGVEGGRAVGTNSQKFQETALEVRSEHRIPVTDQGIWQSVGPDNMLDEEGGHAKRRHGFCRGYENGLFSESVHDNKDCVVVVTGRKIRYPVQRNTAPGPGRNRKGI